MLQKTLLYILIGCVLVLGIISNILYIGVVEAAFYAIMVMIGAHYIISEIECVVHGKCYIRSWMHTFFSVLTFGSLGLYYTYVLLKKHTIRDLKSQPIMENQYISSAVYEIHKLTGIDLATTLKF